VKEVIPLLILDKARFALHLPW